MRYLVAFGVCGVEIFAYLMIAVAMEWKRGGGVVPMAIMFAIVVGTWKGIVGGRRKPEEEPTDKPVAPPSPSPIPPAPTQEDPAPALPAASPSAQAADKKPPRKPTTRQTPW